MQAIPATKLMEVSYRHFDAFRIDETLPNTDIYPDEWDSSRANIETNVVIGTACAINPILFRRESSKSRR